MVRAKEARKLIFDAKQGRFLEEQETSSSRFRQKLRHPYEQSFCELCWRVTEFAIATEARVVYKRVNKVIAKPVPITDSMREEVRKDVDAVVLRFKEALAGKRGPSEYGMLLATYCDPIDMRGDRSIEAFRDQAERTLLNAAWARRGDLLSATRLPGQLKTTPRPSKLYCECHNPRRSDEARRAYQRDRRFQAEFGALIKAIWMVRAGELPTSDIEAHAYVRREAYHQLQKMKMPPTRSIVELQEKGETSRTAMAKQLGISRQAVSAAIKRQKRVATADAVVRKRLGIEPIEGVEHASRSSAAQEPVKQFP
ncbi:hypothetical protein [Propionivibrio soli]|uniref:hypothetical protein n=1 Tax=Propionivibrio soli TaxID=2976531 RepID=UPI0021E99261|nr:hypothetical protein [Propionivibrio soli]